MKGRLRCGEFQKQLGGVMPDYMLLLYAGEPTAEEAKQRETEMPKWQEYIEGLAADGVLVSTGRLSEVDSATTVRVRDQDTQIIDGPFATTKEYLGGYFL